jgi:hypothetical protein
MFKGLSITALCIGCFFAADAQVDSVSRNTTVIHFNKENEPIILTGNEAAGNTQEKSAKHKNQKPYYASALKAGILESLSGIYALSFEKEITDLISIEVSAGLTGRDFIGPLLSLNNDDPEAKPQHSKTFIAGNDIYDDDESTDTRKAALGFYAGIKPKLYFDDDGFEGGYLYINLQQRSNKYTAFGNVDFTGNLIPGNDIKELQHNITITLGSGIQKLFDKACVDYYGGIGIRSFNEERRDLGYVTDASGIQSTAVGSRLRKESGTALYIELGLKIGLWWK